MEKMLVYLFSLNSANRLACNVLDNVLLNRTIVSKHVELDDTKIKGQYYTQKTKRYFIQSFAGLEG